MNSTIGDQATIADLDDQQDDRPDRRAQRADPGRHRRGDEPNTYEDQRDQLIDTLSTYLSRPDRDPSRRIDSLVTVDGIRRSSTTPSRITWRTRSSGTNANGTPQLQLISSTPPNPVNPPPLNVTGGQLGGLLDVYNNEAHALLRSSSTTSPTRSRRKPTGSRRAAYDSTGQPPARCCSPRSSRNCRSAPTNIAVGITTPSAFPIATASTLAGNLVQAMNSANNSVDTTAALTSGGSTVTAGGAAGTNTVTVAGASAVADGYSIGQTITLSAGTANVETAVISGIAGNVLTLQANLVNNHAVGDTVTYGTQSLNNAPTGALSGSWTIGVDGINQTWDYSAVPASSTSTTAAAAGANTITVQNASQFTIGQTIVVGQGADQELDTITAIAGNVLTFGAAFANNHAIGEAVGGNASTVNDVVNSFNGGHYGVTVSFDATSQQFVFSRDPTNIDLVHRAAQGANPATPAFTITDSNQAGAVPPPSVGTPATSLLMALGASNISGVQQNATNAWGATNGGGANALLSLFSNNFGVPALQTTDGNLAATAPGLITTTGFNGAFATINVGDVLTIDAGTANQENVTVTAVNRNTGQISFNAKNPHGINFAITTAQTQTLQTYYSNLVALMGTDTQTAITGNTSQTALANNVNSVRQSVDGINIDEETQNLVKFQNAYGAAAHVVNTLDVDAPDRRLVWEVQGMEARTHAHRNQHDLYGPDAVDRLALGTVPDHRSVALVRENAQRPERRSLDVSQDLTLTQRRSTPRAATLNNANAAQNQLTFTDSVLSCLTNVLCDRAQFGRGRRRRGIIPNGTQRPLIGKQVEGLINQAIQLANSQVR